MSHSPFISIIMPVYNAEKYLSSAIEGVLKQTFENFELILVNDCSLDKSGLVCDEYARRDKRIHVVHLEKNGGAGNARNKGMDLAHGTYITFVDADDEIEETLYADVYAKIEQYGCDTVVWGLVEDYYDKNEKCVSQNTLVFEEMMCSQKSDVENILLMLEEKTLLGYQWNKVYKTEILKRHEIRFEEAILYEDYFFNIEFMKHAQSMYVMEKAYYHYKKRMNDSITTKYIPEYFKLSYRRVKTLYVLCNKWGVDKERVHGILGTIYLRYILSALMRNSDARSGMGFAKQKNWIKKVAEDKLYQKLCANQSVNGVSLKVLHKLIDAKAYGVCVLMGMFVCKFKQVAPVFFLLLKRNKK